MLDLFTEWLKNPAVQVFVPVTFFLAFLYLLHEKFKRDATVKLLIANLKRHKGDEENDQ